MLDHWRWQPGPTIESMEHPAQLEEVEDLARAMASPTWAQAVTWLRGYLPPGILAQIRELIAEHNPDWPAGYHLGWGMGVRNALREHGFGEQVMGVRNLDNVYVALVEEAACASGTLDERQVVEEARLRKFALALLGVGLVLLLLAALLFRWW